jgi:hypothetical protein
MTDKERLREISNMLGKLVEEQYMSVCYNLLGRLEGSSRPTELNAVDVFYDAVLYARTRKMNTKDETIEDLARVLDDAATLLLQAVERAEGAMIEFTEKYGIPAKWEPDLSELANWCESARETLAEAMTLI